MSYLPVEARQDNTRKIHIVAGTASLASNAIAPVDVDIDGGMAMVGSEHQDGHSLASHQPGRDSGLARHGTPDQQSGMENPSNIDVAADGGAHGGVSTAQTHNDAPPSVLTPDGDGLHGQTDSIIASDTKNIPRRRLNPCLKRSRRIYLSRSQQACSAPPSTSEGPAVAATSVNQDMSSRYGFLSFPAEIRNQIYDYACHWPDSRSLYAHYNREIDEYYAARRAGDATVKFPVWQGYVKTPTILLLCRQITRECRPILESRFLVIDRLPPWPKGASQHVPLTKFITKKTLQSVKCLEIRFTLGQGEEGSGWYWIKIITELFDILLEENCFRELRIVLCLTSLSDPDVWVQDTEYLKRIQSKTWQLTLNNPNIWAAKEINSEVWMIDGLEAHRLCFSAFPAADRVRFLDESQLKALVVETVHYPNEKIWPVSILDFI
ncbi:hypothetical protein CONLIGDRAFT_243120 [Coniochaeta ligniaria NRRL 30616]|uniref:Uncharacterized protein n=1 Tax=Coniochaeta ligniaria NRRL 30616 TaxID=1408157 RepID=A0A1J7IWH5_9PEZI|nr:hypothetical protein CONLIGDRAFT_243120 [Coniochaeta ligniaria NRRL 30616]